MILPAVRERLQDVIRHPGMEGALAALRSGGQHISLSGLHDVAKALVAADFTHELRRPAFFVTESNRRAEELAESLRFFSNVFPGPAGGVATLPAFDTLPWEAQSPHPDILERRAATLFRLVDGQISLVIAPIAAALWRYSDPTVYLGLARTLATDAELPLEELIAHLAAVGYARTEMVELPGQFALRGGIIDVFSPEAPRPVRIELLGDTVESVREFDPRTQRSVAPVVRTTILPLTEWAIGASAAALGTEMDYDEPPGFFGPRRNPAESTLFELAESSLRPVLFLDEPQSLRATAAKHLTTATEVYERHGQATSPTASHYFWSEEELATALEKTSQVRLEQLALNIAATPQFALPSRPSPRFHGDVAACIGDVKSQLAAGGSVFLTASSTGEIERFGDICREYEVPYVLGESEDAASGFTAERAQESAALVLVRAPFAEGVSFPDARVTIFGNADLFDVAPAIERPGRKIRTSGFFSDFAELKPGDFVVHVDHGIGQFEGLRQIESDGRRGEFMLLKYAEDARLYVPLERMDLVQGYRAVEGAHPPLDRLGGTSWTSRKTRARKSVEEMADKLLALYAERKTSPGFSFSPDGNFQREFEDTFEFEETPDQVTAIADIKRDMERSTPTDRLLCGDVGYGKTEVAMRAAFKAVADGKQVALLAPTTILAFQHFETFKRRFAAFPLRIEMLSRFRSAGEQKQILAALETGKVDVVIGTHRLLSKDVKFQDLGLLVVDEEQRFGVAHKERLKEMRKNVDALAMSATPIPRTLHMSLVGLRDMSVIETPPRDRLAIQTVVASFQEELVRHAIENELARDGQVFFIHNRVESIYSLAELIMKLVPKARVVVGHGQMAEKELERVMLKFIRDEADVLVATTIVENGLDIPRANTILINRADRLGLAELYQLRGRVGRSNQRAYAYLLVPPETALSEIARRRLAAMKEFSELGAGFRIAALDLELRGAGNMLGRQQHGHIEAIGFDLYCQMLERAVSKLKGEDAAPELRTTLSLGFDVRIPQDYVPSENLRLRTYKRISTIATDEEKQDVRRELEDRFGPIPASVENLLEYAVLKSMCERLRISAVERQGSRVAIRFHPETPLDPARLVFVVRSRKGIKLDPGGVLWLEVARGESVPGAVRNVLLGLQGQG
ncbi:MAG TPA: transcription-repair coupling factor [Candidatus Acidoferrum sp.]|jgi:transcription-repair coupling factor (superfamily II helicase)|nr:transcription-repair coupling factor [Candidatus Acidoferrum sp.]